MAKISDVIKQLQSQMPKYTNDFCDINNIIGATATGVTMTVELEEANDVDSYINVIDLYASITAIGVTATGVTDQYNIEFGIKHDQTFSDLEKTVMKKYVSFAGDFSGTYEIIDVPTSKIITIESSTAPSGSFSLLEDRDFSGRKAVTFIDSTHLRYTIGQAITPYFTGSYIQSNIRIDAVSAPEDIADYLENEAVPLDKNTIFVTMNESRASKSREIYSDAQNRREWKDDLHCEVVQSFSLFAIIPTQNNITPRTAIDYIHNLRAYIIKSLHGAVFDSGLSDTGKFLMTYLSDDGFLYNKSYYIQRFDFETVYNIENTDALQIEDTRAFREFELGIRLEYDDYTDVKKTIKGDIS